MDGGRVPRPGPGETAWVRSESVHLDPGSGAYGVARGEEDPRGRDFSPNPHTHLNPRGSPVVDYPSPTRGPSTSLVSVGAPSSPDALPSPETLLPTDVPVPSPIPFTESKS